MTPFTASSLAATKCDTENPHEGQILPLGPASGDQSGNIARNHPRLAVVSGLTLKRQSNRNARSTLSATVSDEELVAQYRDSRADSALEELIERHVPKVRAMIFSMVLDDNAADDLTQETLLRAIRAIDSFEGRSQFGTWLYRIAMNATRGFLDRQHRSPVVFRAELVD